MKMKRAIILLGCFILFLCGLAVMSTYGDMDNAADYANKASSYASEVYSYARKTYRSDTLKGAQYYAKKAMDAAEDIQSMAIDAQSAANDAESIAIDAQLAADSAESECYQ